MADKILIFKVGGIIGRFTYSEDLKEITDSRQDTRPGLNADNTLKARLSETDIPGFLDRRGKLDTEPTAGQDLYIHIEGDAMYRVRKQDRNPYVYITSEFYRPLEHVIQQVNQVSEYSENDGSFKYFLRYGSGYVYGINYYRLLTAGGQELSTNESGPDVPAMRVETFNVQSPQGTPGELGQINLYAADYEHRVRDALTQKEYVIKVTIEEPACNLIIEEVATTAESAPGGNDGTITVTATSDNPMEYQLGSSGWQDSNVFTGLTDGQFTLAARDKNQHRCQQLRLVSVEELPCDLVIDQVKRLHESARGVADGRLTVLASSERAIEYAIQLDGQAKTAYQESNIFANLPAGSHQVFTRLKAANTCTESQAVTISAGPDFTAIIDHVTCGNAPTGRVQITLADNIFHGDLAPMTYQWEDGSTELFRENLKPGDYAVQITTSDGRTNEFTFTVNGQPPIQIAATVDQGNVSLSVSGGTAPYTFRWNDVGTDGLQAVTSQNRTGLEPDTYIVTVTDATGCTKQENIFVRIPQHYFSENKIALEVFAFELDTKPNFSYVCEIYLEQEYLSDDFSRIGELEHSVDGDGKTVFEVQDYLNAYLEPTLPDVSAGLVRLDSQFKRFYLRFTEKFGVEPELSTFSQQETFYVLLGGLSFEEYSTKDFFLHYLPEQRPFYTWQPLEKEVLPDQPEFLHYLINADNLPEFRVRMRLHFQDGSSEEQQLFSTDAMPGVSPGSPAAGSPAAINQYELFRFPAGYKQLSVGGYSCHRCHRYELFVADGNDVQISEARSYVVNYEYYEEQNFFFFLNSLGCYDTLAATGRSRYQLGVDQETVSRELPYDYRPSDRAVEVVQKSGEPEVLQPVGYPTKEMMLSLQDFVLSKAYYKYEDNRVIPITVNIRRSTILDRDENLQEMDFTYELPRMEKFTPKLKSANTNSNLTAQATIAGRSISLEVTGGKPAYEYLWSDGNTGKDRANLPNGNYSVRITDQSAPPKATSICDLLVDQEPIISEAFTMDAVWAPETDNVYGVGPAHRFIYEPYPSVASLFPVCEFTVAEGESYRIRAYLFLPDAPDKFEFYPSNDPKVAGRITLFLGGYDGPFAVTADPNLRGQWQYVESVATVTVNNYAGFSFSSQVVYDIRAFSKYDLDAGDSYGPPPMLISDLTIEHL